MEKIEFWIAANGNDEHTGTEQMPLKTTEEALARIRKADYQSASVYYKGGKYFWSKPIVLTDADHDIRFCAAGEETPEICGAFPITGWKEETVNGITMWVTRIEEGKRQFRSMFNEKAVLPRPRWPKKDFFSVKNALDEEGYGIHDAIYKMDPNVRMNYAMYVDPQDLMDFKNKTDVTVRVIHYWKDEIVDIKDMDLASGHIVFSRPATMTIKTGDRYYFENVWEAMSEPGEWYMDRTSGNLYYIPFPEERIEQAHLYAASTEQLVVCDGGQNISFEGLDFRMTDWSIPTKTFNSCGADHHQAAYDVIPTFYFTNAGRITFKDCRFSRIMGNCLKFGYNVQGITVTGNSFQNLGANAIYVVGANLKKENPSVTRDFLISDNLIAQYGQYFFNATALGILHGAEGEISNNEIHDGYYTAITIGWVWGYGYSVTSDILVKQNHIYNVGLNLLSDMGAVYTLGVKEGIVITENVIHNVKANLQYGYGGWGIYTDEGSSNVWITKNVVYDCNSTAFYQHYGRDNIVINNILAFAEEGQVSSFRDQPHVGFHLIRNIIVSEGSDFVCMDDLIARKIRGRFNDANNIYWDYKEGDRGIDTEWFVRELGVYNTATFTDPGFMDWQNRDFALRSDSPVFDLGFISWDITKAGRKKKG